MNQVEVKRRQIEVYSYIIGLINILVFGKILGDCGITYLVIALEGFSFVQTIVSDSLSNALGKMLRGRNTKGKNKNVKNIKKRVVILQFILGLIGSVLFAVCATPLAEHVFKVQYSAFIMMILAPALFMRSMSATLIGFFQGEGMELPAAVSAVLRQAALLGFGLLFANLRKNYGEKVSNLLGNEAYTAMHAGVGIAIAVDLAELLILLFLGLITFGSRRSSSQKSGEGMRQTDSFISTIQTLYGTMGLAVLIQMLERLPIWLGALFYRKSVMEVESFAEVYGLFVGKYAVICGFAVLPVCAALLSVNARTVGYLRRDDQRSVKNSFQSGLHIGIVWSVFAAVFIAMMGEQLAGIFCQTNVKVATDMLRWGSAVVLLAVLGFYFSGLLMLMGKEYHLLGSLGLASIIFTITISLLLNTNNAKPGAMALIYASLVSGGVYCLVLGFLCCRLLHTGVEWLQTIAVPAGAACITGLFCMLLGKLFTPHLGNLVTGIVCLVLAFLVYWVILILFRSFREQELKYIPGGRLILAAGQMLHVF